MKNDLLAWVNYFREINIFTKYSLGLLGFGNTVATISSNLIARNPRNSLLVLVKLSYKLYRP
jgi:hypothetical protein